MATYTAAEKQRATQRAMEIGTAAAARELGIPVGTLSCWKFEARQQDRPSAPEAGPVAPAPEAAASPVASTKRARVAKVYTPSQIANALERVAAIGVRPAARELGISRTTLRAWEAKAARAAKGEGPAPTSGPDPKDVAADRDARILREWNKQQGLGPSQIRNQLRRDGIRVSVQTVRRVMEENGYRPPKVERRDHNGRYEAVRPDQIWHLDFLTVPPLLVAALLLVALRSSTRSAFPIRPRRR